MQVLLHGCLRLWSQFLNFMLSGLLELWISRSGRFGPFLINHHQRHLLLWNLVLCYFMVRYENFAKNVFDDIIIFLNDFVSFAKFGPNFNCPYLLKGKPLLVKPFKFSSLKSKIRKSNISFCQNSNLATFKFSEILRL